MSKREGRNSKTKALEAMHMNAGSEDSEEHDVILSTSKKQAMKPKGAEGMSSARRIIHTSDISEGFLPASKVRKSKKRVSTSPIIDSRVVKKKHVVLVSSDSEDEFPIAKKLQGRKTVVEKHSKQKCTSKPAVKSSGKRKTVAVASKLSDDSGDEWEEIYAGEGEVNNLSAQLQGGSSGGVTVVVDKKKDDWWKNYMAQQLRKVRKIRHMNLHKTVLICYLAAGLYRNSLINDELLKASVLSIIPGEFLGKRRSLKSWNVETVKLFLKWFLNRFTYKELKLSDVPVTLERLLAAVDSGKCCSYCDVVLLLVSCLRVLGFKSRLAWSCRPPDLKNRTELSEYELKIQERLLEERKRKQDTGVENKCADEHAQVENDTVCDDHEMDDVTALLLRTENYSQESLQGTQSSYFKSGINTDTFEERASTSPHLEGKVQPGTSKNSDKLPTSNDTGSAQEGVDMWAEVFLQKDGFWCSVSNGEKLVNVPLTLEKHATQPVSYVFAFDNFGRVKDVTKRYAFRWGSVNQKSRVEWVGKSDGCVEWFDEFLKPWRPLDRNFDERENIQINDQMSNLPIPTSISELKDHPLYVLERHLLKYEVIHPKTAEVLGHVKSEPVYSRSNLKLCHTQISWFKEGMSIKNGECPAKYVKALVATKKKLKSVIQKDEVPMVGIYGDWQVEIYKAPPVVDGRIPRNEYNNVDLFKMHMLPPGSVFLDLPGIDKVAKDLDVDCVPAMRGWDFNGYHAVPILEGFVVCSENEDLLREVWQDRKHEAEMKQRTQRAVANWTKLIKAFKIRQMIQLKYEYSDENTHKAHGREDEFEII